jgi:hypothetical protein
VGMKIIFFPESYMSSRDRRHLDEMLQHLTGTREGIRWSGTAVPHAVTTKVPPEAFRSIRWASRFRGRSWARRRTTDGAPEGRRVSGPTRADRKLRVRTYLRRKHCHRTRAYQTLPQTMLYGRLGLCRLPTRAPWIPPTHAWR